MFPVELFYIGFLAWAVLWPVSAAQRGLPLLSEEEVPTPQTPERVQKHYDNGYQTRQTFRILMPALAIFYPAWVFTLSSSEVADYSSIAPVGLAVVPLFLASYATGILIRVRRERVIVRKHPTLADGVISPLIRVVGFLVLAIPLCLLELAILNRAEDAIANSCIAAALIVLIGGQKLLLKMWVKNQVAVTLDSPLGIAVASTVQQFGFQPKRFVMLRSLTPNGYALKDGSVTITSTLHHLATIEEIQAILAHELSHAKDGDAKKILRLRLLLVTAVTLIVCGESFFLAMRSIPFGLILPCSVCLAPTLFMLVALVMARLTQPMEFKCDADVAKIGLGPQLASGLEKLTLCLGAPPHWKGIERFLLSHPSTAMRVERILAQSPH